MLTAEENRRLNTLKIIDERCGGVKIVFAEKMGMSPQYVGAITKGRKTIGHKTARRIEEVFELASGSLDFTQGPDDLLAQKIALLTPEERTSIQMMVDALLKSHPSGR